MVGNKKLVTASFFFWRIGSPLQRSLSGLVRTLLHDILESCSDLIPTVLPDLWSKVVSSPGGISVGYDLGSDEVQAAFSRLLVIPALYENSRFCFFIDALDEFEETI